MDHIPDNIANLAGGYRVVALHDAHVIAGHYPEGMAGTLVVEHGGRSGNGQYISYDSSEASLGSALVYIAENLTADHHPRSHDAPHYVSPDDIELIPIEDDLPPYAGQAWTAHIRGYDPARALDAAERAGRARDASIARLTAGMRGRTVRQALDVDE